MAINWSAVTRAALYQVIFIVYDQLARPSLDTATATLLLAKLGHFKGFPSILND